MNRPHDRAVQRGIQLAPFAGGYDRAGSQAHGFEHAANDHRVSREHFTDQGNRGFVRTSGTRCLHRAGQHFFAGKFQHRTGEHVFGFGMGGNAKAGDVNTDDAHTVDVFG